MQTQIPFGNDNQRQRQEQRQTQIPFGNDNQRSKSKGSMVAALALVRSLV
ncbi:hypothetical protein GRAN_3169 [Granulicella sibirica]|uniref:Uncharacterized protein n=1 Tax=Granulicella sibirica TaxID=2479048 RepID=A0A4Q0T0Q5_9BACT|nr:hypothetical protein GRAN_3169 [Granulicella sibirica]